MTGKILVVDDEPLILTAVERALSKVGHAIVKAQNMAEIEAALGRGPFDLLITDVYMQEATSESIIEKVREGSPEVKVLRMSGSLNRDNSVAFIEKPFSIADLRTRVKDILHGPS
jgi:two-component system cell cycle sensor histidine kinase/response regulator CckA